MSFVSTTRTLRPNLDVIDAAHSKAQRQSLPHQLPTKWCSPCRRDWTGHVLSGQSISIVCPRLDSRIRKHYIFHHAFVRILKPLFDVHPMVQNDTSKIEACTNKYSLSTSSHQICFITACLLRLLHFQKCGRFDTLF